MGRQLQKTWGDVGDIRVRGFHSERHTNRELQQEDERSRREDQRMDSPKCAGEEALHFASQEALRLKPLKQEPDDN